MDIFVSWSGSLSQAVALALDEWLPNLFHDADVFVSSRDIQAGARWSTELAQRLERTSYGIICVTQDNQQAPWLNFEAGALAKSVDDAYVTPLAIDLLPSEIQIPLGQFQSLAINKAGISDLVRSINAANSGTKLEAARLETIFEKFWPDLELAFAAALEAANGNAGAGPATRSEADMLQEIVVSVRGISRQLAKIRSNQGDLTGDNLLSHFASIARDVAPEASIMTSEDESGNRVLRVYQVGGVEPEARRALKDAADAVGVSIGFGKLVPRPRKAQVEAPEPDPD